MRTPQRRPGTWSGIRGWNGLAVREEVVVPDDPAIVGPIWRWDPQLGRFVPVLPGGKLLPGWGYWVFVTSPTRFPIAAP